MLFRGKLGQFGGVGKIGSGIKTGVQKGWSGAKSVGGGVKRAGGAAIAGGSFMGGLAAGGFGKAKKHGGTLIVILAFLLFAYDKVFDYKGFDITSIDSVFGVFKFVTSLGYALGAAVFFYYFVSRERSFRSLAPFIIAMVLGITAMAMAFRFGYTIGPVLHMIFIIIFWFGFIRQREDPVAANWWLVGFIFLDFYLYSLLNSFSPAAANILIGIPWLFLFIIVVVYERTNNKLALIFMIITLIYYLATAGPAFAEGLSMAGIEVEKPEIPSLSEVPKRFYERIIKEPFKKFGEGSKAWVSGQIQYAITGKVEDNKYEPLGVYLENVQSAEQKYYLDEDVIVWGTVKAKTLDDEIKIKVGCYVKKDKEKRYAEPPYGRTDPDPSKTFSVFTLEEQDFACTFDRCCEPNDKPEVCKEKRSKCTLKEGSNTITTFADFNFETLAYLKTYFIDNDRKRAMVREGLDIFDEFEIKDKTPVAVYTNGPVEIGMETTTLIGVGNAVNPALTITLQNREGWEGKITALKELVLFFPPGAGLDLSDTNPPCNKEFKKVENKEDFCENSCESGSGKCKETCIALFEGGYNAYSLDLTDLEVQRDLKDFEKFKMFRCRFKPDASVLEKTPITTKFFRVKAKYDYTVEKPVTARIEKLPEETGGTTSTPGATTTTSGGTTQAKIPSELGQPDANGIYTYTAPGATPIWYRYYVGKPDAFILSPWRWTPYDPYNSGIDCWMPVTTILPTVRNDCGGKWDGKQPSQENIDIIKYLAANNPVPTT